MGLFMKKQFILTAFLGFSVLLGAIATPTPEAYAESGSYKKSSQRKKEKPEPKKGVFDRTVYETTFFHDPSDPENIFYFRISAPLEVTGCFRITKPKYMIKNAGQYINLDFLDSEIYVKKRTPRYSQYDCELKRAASIIDIQLDRDEMIANGVKKISVNSEKYGRFQDVALNVTKEKIELTLPNIDAREIDMLWFYPKNTIVLHAPQGKQGDTKVRDAIREYGIAEGFTPMEDVLKGYELPWDADNYVVFTDENGAVRNQLHTPRDHLPIGHVEVTRTMHGAQGLYEEPYELEVFATLPGHEIVTRDGYRKNK